MSLASNPGGFAMPRTMSMGGRSTKTINRGVEIQRRRSLWLMEAGDAFKEEEKIQLWTDRWIAISMGFIFVMYWLVGAGIFLALQPQWNYLE
jgi:hypothetical protein